MFQYVGYYWPVWCFGIVMAVLAVMMPGTCDDGDSVHHYLSARHAIQHPALFFNHWAKPFHVLVMAPFAQMGMVGVKLANVALMCLAMWCTIGIAALWGVRFPWLAGLLMGTMPELVQVTLSGLTEPLFATILVLAVYWICQRRYVWAAVLLSFLPFVRSEGLLIVGVTMLYFAHSRQWATIWLLLIGHVAYGLAGWPYYGDPFWVLGGVPYGKQANAYGHGSWFHFFREAPHYWGWVVSLLTLCGFIMGLQRVYDWFKGVRGRFWSEYLLVFVFFTVYFGGHVVFWGLGIFSSFGLTRVMTGIGCMGALLALWPSDRMLETVSRKIGSVAAAGIVCGILVAGMLKSPGFFQRFQLSPFQQSQKAIRQAFERSCAQEACMLYADAVNLGMALDVDWFGSDRAYTYQMPKTGAFERPTVVIWDYWYSVMEAGTTLDQLLEDSRLQLIDVQRATGQVPEPVTVLFADTAQHLDTDWIYYQGFERAGAGRDPDKAATGRYSFALGGDNPYGPLAEPAPRQWQSRDSLWISCDVFLADTALWEARYVVEYRDPVDQRLLFWESCSFNQQLRDAGRWQHFERILPCRNVPVTNALVRMFPWNPTGQVVWIDNIELKYR